MTHNHNPIRPGLIFIRCKPASYLRRNTEHRKQGRGNATTVDTFRISNTRKIETCAGDGGDTFEYLVLVAPVDEVRGGWRIARMSSRPRVLIDHHQPFGIFVR